MEINITRIVREEDVSQYSGAQAKIGDTWKAAVDAGETFLTTEKEFSEFREWARSFGTWEDGEIEAWSPEECNALILQYVSGDIRELESLCPSGVDEDGFIDWEQAEILGDKGTVSGCIYKGSDGEFYFSMGS